MFFGGHGVDNDLVTMERL